ncbi:hypothetical protein Dda_7294 [Drechslerella dactyloides]|uniref:Uncharacterized protein n=1 Tax=Drechslerella dactyloides TaxID=74499 RepID=A0AAD6IT50_DREDA|nr:hypothetical protein Dda_7294 [Drechslerella dactyloides]
MIIASGGKTAAEEAAEEAAVCSLRSGLVWPAGQRGSLAKAKGVVDGRRGEKMDVSPESRLAARAVGSDSFVDGGDDDGDDEEREQEVEAGEKEREEWKKEREREREWREANVGWKTGGRIGSRHNSQQAEEEGGAANQTTLADRIEQSLPLRRESTLLHRLHPEGR